MVVLVIMLIIGSIALLVYSKLYCLWIIIIMLCPYINSNQDLLFVACIYGINKLAKSTTVFIFIGKMMHIKH